MPCHHCSPKDTCCKSCCMPMKKPEDFGTNADGSKNKNYCIHCYKDGKFLCGPEQPKK